MGDVGFASQPFVSPRRSRKFLSTCRLLTRSWRCNLKYSPLRLGNCPITTSILIELSKGKRISEWSFVNVKTLYFFSLFFHHLSPAPLPRFSCKSSRTPHTSALRPDLLFIPRTSSCVYLCSVSSSLSLLLDLLVDPFAP